jgi:arylsulfatase A-like enzyme
MATPTDNVVIIHVDDLGWRDLACMGSPVYETPYIDALAKSGTLFTHAYAAY